jgi:hypothetical protein
MPAHNPSDRCTYRDTAGRRCRLPRKATHPDFCAHHARLNPDGAMEDPQALVSQILGSSPDFADARAVNQSLGNLIALFLGGRIPVRHAAVAGYLFQSLIQTLPQIERQEKPAALSAPFDFITHIPQPDYSRYFAENDAANRGAAATTQLETSGATEGSQQ